MKRRKDTMFRRELCDEVRDEQHLGADAPYFEIVAGLDEYGTDYGIDEQESAIFLAVGSHESACYDRRGTFTGPVVFECEGREFQGKPSVKQVIPDLLCAAAMKVVSCSADHVFVVESAQVLDLVQSSQWHRSGASILVSGHGVPAIASRLFAKKLAAFLRVPIVVLADIDPWGYFIASLIRRGMLDPSVAASPLSHDAFFLGLSSVGDVVAQSDALGVAWKPAWKLRLDAMRKYPCFYGEAWQSEFDQIEERKKGVSLIRLLLEYGSDGFVDGTLLRSLDERLLLRLD